MQEITTKFPTICGAPMKLQSKAKFPVAELFESGQVYMLQNRSDIPYFFDFKTRVFSFQNNPKDLDTSCKMDLDLWDCLGRVKLIL